MHLPAKAMVYNIMQFNEWKSWMQYHCLQNGKELAVGARGKVHVY